jgi:hypothetical protein
MNILITDTDSVYTKTPLHIEDGDWKTLCLKIWNRGIEVDGREIQTTEDLKWLIEDVLCIGYVDRIDESVRKTRIGIEQRVALIHLRVWDQRYGRELRESINEIGCFTADESVKTRKLFRNWHGGRSFFRFYKNAAGNSNTNDQ